MSLGITVHHFTKSSEKLPIGLVDSARALVQTAVLDSTVWHLPTRAPAPCYNKPKVNAFRWTQVPPRVECKSAACFLPDWNSSSPATQVPFCPSPIDEFESTDFSRPLQSMSCLKNVPAIPRRRFATDLDTNSEAGIYKRARLGDEASFSIFQTIPLPHYLDVPFPSRPPPKGIDKIPDFPIFCCLVPSIRLRPCYARTAWIIPLRGSASVEASAEQSCTNSSNVLWNKSALSQFWTFLSQQRIHHRFGPLSFGYIYAPPSTKQVESMSRLNVSCPTEYIKIYHDVKYAMKIRSVIDSFRCNDSSSASAGLITVCRIFKGKKLMLVDEKCRPILLA